jgi:cephalosporin-C deacetylase
MFKAISYFGNIIFADWIKERAISCAMKDTCCPPSTIFAVFNQVTGPKQMIKMPYFGHIWETMINFDENRVELLKKYL